MTPYVDHQAMALVLGNALSFLLEERKGIIAQGETPDHQMHKFAVYRMNGKIRATLADHLVNLEIGTKIYVDSEQILKAAVNGGEYIIE